LPYVRTVAQSHGGSIVVDSADGRGTTFMLDLPLDTRPVLNGGEERRGQ
jgi:signal transduction histidine kinase